MGWTNPGLLVQIGQQGLARSEKFDASIHLGQTSPKTTWPIQDHQIDFTSRLPTGSASLMDDS